MASAGFQDKVSAIQEIKKKHRLLHAIATFIIFVLFAVIIRFLYEPVASYLDFLPEVSITLIIPILLFLSVIGLFLSRMLTRQTLRIIEDYSRRLDRILNITRDLREELYGDILLEKILDYALSMTQSNAGSLLLLDEEGKLTFKIVKGEKASEIVGTSVEPGKGIVGWVAESGMPLRLEHATGDSRFHAEIDAMTGYETRSILCVPLKTGDGVIGVLELLNREGGHTYRVRDEEVLTYLAEQAAISIIKSKFYEDQKNYEIHLTELLLEAIDYHVQEKSGHARRVARYSNIIARTLNMSDGEKKTLYFASLLHDVGFLKIKSDDTYKKEEYMKHPVLGYEMIKPINLYASIAPAILHHHERYDGLGYPSNLKGEDIPLNARIISISEAFDAMVSTASYKVPLNFDEAIEELRRHAGTQFDPELAELFINNVSLELVQ
jgi:hypothetical protein